MHLSRRARDGVPNPPWEGWGAVKLPKGGGGKTSKNLQGKDNRGTVAPTNERGVRRRRTKKVRKRREKKRGLEMRHPSVKGGQTKGGRIKSRETGGGKGRHAEKVVSKGFWKKDTKQLHAAKKRAAETGG